MFYRFFFFIFLANFAFANPKIATQCLLQHYPHFKDNWEIASISTPKNIAQYNLALESSKLADSFAYPYPLKSYAMESYKDSTRIRDYAFLKSIYGDSKANVESHLKPLQWLDGTTLLFNTQNGAYEALLRTKLRLEKLLKTNPLFMQYLKNIGGTYKWRKISGTNRLSPHSFGIAMDINVAQSRYWLWDLKHKAFQQNIPMIPQVIIQAFEEEGFIWGGRWWHYDTMHFEYRPEILCYAKKVKTLKP
ncbi:M15 family peptidase [Helicobacter sp. MIT 11-5569]|uniref:M15 family metallopeptidase n=1 Tax=Helicobacter sp. MIT 11-5569 TaxID=1548151 RepID=UPI0010FCFC17|nr:M15 family metallopeptidase [Helicobacter sp. MIT 11-5569]TLD84081.1 M15 family peptidase [Helicobacter sp. MIT 11-5569]